MRAVGGREDVALGVLAHLWMRCLENKQPAFNRPKHLDYVLGPIDRVDAVLIALQTAGYVKLEYGCYEVVDVQPWIARAHVRLAKAKKAGEKSVKVRAKKKALAKRAEKKLANEDKEDTTLAAQAAWEAYRGAYSRLFHCEPVRNVKTNSLIRQLCKRLPMWNVQHVLSFYVGHGNAFYAQRMYPLDLAVKDAESLYTQWETGISVTQSTMDQFKQREKMRGALEEGINF